MAIQARANREPIAPRESEIDAIRTFAALLASAREHAVSIVTSEGNTAEIPPAVLAALAQVSDALAGNHAIAVVPIERDLTSDQAAGLLNVPVSYLVKLLDTDEIPSSGSGSDRHVTFDDLIGYKRLRDAQRRETLDELTQLSEELGLYETCP